jgi:hypothetical protein
VQIFNGIDGAKEKRLEGTIGIKRGVSKGVEDSRRPPIMQAATPETAVIKLCLQMNTIQILVRGP